MVRHINPARRNTNNQRPAMLQLLQTNRIIWNQKSSTLHRPRLHTMARLHRLPPNLQHRNSLLLKRTTPNPHHPPQNRLQQCVNTQTTQSTPNFNKQKFQTNITQKFNTHPTRARLGTETSRFPLFGMVNLWITLWKPVPT